MTHKDNTPTFNVNRKVVNFKDFLANPNAEKEELKKMDRQNKPNSDEYQKNFANSRYKFNNTTRKMDDLSPDQIEDEIDAIDEFEGTNENTDFDFSKMATEYINSEESEDESWSNEEQRAIKSFASWLNKKHEAEPKESYKDKMRRLVDKSKKKYESVVNESMVDDRLFNKIQKTEAYKTLTEEIHKSISKFQLDLMKNANEIGYDEGDTDHDMAVIASIQEVIDSYYQ